MVDLSEDTNFMNRLKKTHRPVVLTVNGKAELVVQDAASYQQTLDRLARFEAVEAIRLGIGAAEDGRVRPARQALADLHEPALIDAEEYPLPIREVKKEPEAAARWFR